ncbi:MAG: hypothetical protein GVY16_11480 [Planctomycetes bacterium]|jgi:hypothetical protein|nr:hypothetical protein [Phycisphaerae bacterium]NBB96344.1 hypothetical protein [Planctomycetota bacterium]
MNLAENKFLIITVAVAVVLAGGLIYYGTTISSTIEKEQVAQRKSVMSSMPRFASGTPANRKTIEAKKQRVAAMKKQRRKVIESDIEFNRREDAYVIPELTLKAEGNAKRPALPFAESVWDRNGLYFDFVNAYFAQLDEQVASMRPAALPTAEQIQAEAAKIQKVLDRQRLRETKTDPDAPSGRRPGSPTGHYTAGRSSTVTASDEASEEAIDKATQQLRLQQARRGDIYVDINSFDLMFVRNAMVTDLPAARIWDAHLAMWVSADVVDAIEQTIAEVYRVEKVPEDRRSVLTSPVKRLVSVMLDRDGETTRRKSTPDVRGGMPRAATGRARWREDDRPAAATLSQRITQPMYSVVPYTFTVIMPTRHLPLLQKKLIGLNYHTVLNIDIQPVDPTADATGLYYYGTEPVGQVIVHGELLLLSDWVRGTWQQPQRTSRGAETEEGTWLRPPLMPVSVMKDRLQPVQRRETDTDLIEGKLPRPWDPAWTPPETTTGRSRRR